VLFARCQVQDQPPYHAEVAAGGIPEGATVPDPGLGTEMDMLV